MCNLPAYLELFMSRDLRLLQADVIAFSSRVNAMASILRIMIDNIDVMLALQAAMMQGNTPPPPPSPTTTPLALGPAPRFLTIDGRKTLTRKASARCLQAGLVAEDVAILSLNVALAQLDMEAEERAELDTSTVV